MRPNNSGTTALTFTSDPAVARTVPVVYRTLVAEKAASTWPAG